MGYKPRLRKRRAERVQQARADAAAEAANTASVTATDSHQDAEQEPPKQGVTGQHSCDELADLQADDRASPEPQVEQKIEQQEPQLEQQSAVESEQQWPPPMHPRDETGVTKKEADILTQRAIRHGWIHAPFMTHVPKSELEQIPEEERSLEHKAVLSVHDALDFPSFKVRDRAAKTAVLMVNANTSANKTNSQTTNITVNNDNKSVVITPRKRVRIPDNGRNENVIISEQSN